jgi:hypothetical protein
MLTMPQATHQLMRSPLGVSGYLLPPLGTSGYHRVSRCPLAPIHVTRGQRAYRLERGRAWMNQTQIYCYLMGGSRGRHTTRGTHVHLARQIHGRTCMGQPNRKSAIWHGKHIVKLRLNGCNHASLKATPLSRIYPSRLGGVFHVQERKTCDDSFVVAQNVHRL